ncbi:MAG TPA: hypothetical protein DCZ13_12855, partial [Porticoccaceae bacterium]|nr:hypothetical protein [Porticoccaceae bacterium]
MLAAVAKLPEHCPESVIPNHERDNQEEVVIRGYTEDAIEVGISADGTFLLFNDRNEPNKDLYWAKKISDTRYDYRGKVKNMVSNTVDGTPSFYGLGNAFNTSLKNFLRYRRSGGTRFIRRRKSPVLPPEKWRA